MNKIKREMYKKHESLYAKIDWKKAADFLGRDEKITHSGGKISASAMLRLLVRAADKGFTFLLHADNPATVEYVLFGTGPLNFRTRQLVQRFHKQKYISVKEDAQGNVMVKITRHGLTRALSYKLNSFTLKKTNHWDKKWRVIIFDIPDRFKRLRDVFRMRLKQLGLYKLQESVYVSPYSCFDEIEFLRELYGIAFTVRYLLVERIEDDESLKKHFILS